MKVEIIAVGSELLLGQITNTNATFISSRLAEIGLDVYYHTVVGDNNQRLKQALQIAEERADVIIFSGGLGPTKDDMTKETIASHLGLSLVYDQQAMDTIQAYFDRSGRVMTENNKKQALVLEGATILENAVGMAPGMALYINKHHYLLLPGPPHEMQPMFQNNAIPYLLKEDDKNEVIVSHVLNFYGIGESDLEHRLRPLLDAQTNPTIAPLASPMAVTLRITAKASSEIEAYRLIEKVDQQIRQEVGEFIYGVNDETLSSRAAKLLSQRNKSIAAAESLTAGLFMGELADEPGIGDQLVGGLVVYNKEAKVKQLGIDQDFLDEYGIVSEQCAQQLAIKVKERFGTAIGVGITGAAGPSPHDGAAAGTIYIGIAIEDDVQTYRLNLSGRRNPNRLRTARFALYYLIRQLEEQE